MDGRPGGGLLVVAVLVLAAGCVGIADDENAGEGENGTAIEASNQSGAQEQTSEQESDEASSEPPNSSIFENASRQPLEEANATALLGAEVQMDDPATLQAFTWTVPEEAVVEDPTWPFDDPPETVILQGASVLEGPTSSLEAWGLFAYNIEGDTAEPLSATVSSPMTVDRWNPTEEAEEHPAQAHPFVMYLGQDELDPGDTVGFVLAARGQADASFGVGLQPMVDPPDDEFPEPPEDVDELRESAPETVLLPREGSGDGLHIGTYIEVPGLLVPDRQTVTTPGVEVQEGLPDDRPPVASARLTTIESTFDADGGWATSGGAAITIIGAQAGRWEVSLDHHGLEVEAGGPHAETPLVATALVTGIPLFSATGGGPGASEVGFTVETASARQIVFFDHLALGEPLETLVGQPAAAANDTFEGIVGQPIVWHTAGDQWTRVGGPGPSLSLPGFPLEAERQAIPG